MYDFLQQGNIPSTHFMIGTNIVNGYDLFQRAFSELKCNYFFNPPKGVFLLSIYFSFLADIAGMVSVPFEDKNRKS